MAAISLTTYLGTPEPKASIFGRSSNLAAAEPTTSEVIGAFVGETFMGEGSLAQDIQAGNIRKQERRGESISEDDWKDSDNYRQGLTYHDTMTKSSAQTLAQIEDDRVNRQLIMDKASKIQTIGGFGVGFLSGIVEPKNLASGVAAAIVTAGAGAVVPSIGRMIATNTVKGAVARGSVEGVAAAAFTEPSNLESSRIVQGDYTMADSILNLTLGAVLGAGLEGGVKAFQLRKGAKAAEIAEAYRAETQGQTVKEFDTALGQVVQGTSVDVAAVKQIEAGVAKSKAIKELPKIEEKIAAKQAQAKKLDATINIDVPSTSILTEEVRVEQGLMELDAQAVSAGEVETVRGGFVVVNNRTGEAVFESFQKSVMDKVNTQNYTVVPSRQYLEKLNRNIKDGVEDYKNVLSGPQEPKLSKEAVAIKEVVAKKKQALADASQPIDTAPIKTLQNQISKNDNSTAYDLRSSDAVTRELEEFGDIDDQIALERELEDMQEQVNELYEQGLLNNEEIATIERLADIDEESAIFDNVLLDAKLCLTRG